MTNYLTGSDLNALGFVFQNWIAICLPLKRAKGICSATVFELCLPLHIKIHLIIALVLSPPPSLLTFDLYIHGQFWSSNTSNTNKPCIKSQAKHCHLSSNTQQKAKDKCTFFLNIFLKPPQLLFWTQSPQVSFLSFIPNSYCSCPPKEAAWCS